ncbi:SDR family oxidoreductase [Persicobacter psychrovividus]|uniref:dTDP-4-dehydrorhamnose reductase n=1 Tax=Persicobacter psychrovividus TaxID=387638 RepID=A0ABN6LG32_9BACT|nr:NAD(P)-dependent oxidoreductase [Persicobacter psychrovividus]
MNTTHTILITGGSGFIASRLAQRYQQSGLTVLAPNRKSLDISDSDAIRQYFELHQPTLVFHLAGMSSTEGCEQNQLLAKKINVDATTEIAKACKAHQAKMVFFSTEQVFNGNSEAGPYTESSTPIPNTYYGTTKLMAETEVLKHCPTAWILRLTWVYGLPTKEFPKVNPNILWDSIVAGKEETLISASKNEYRGLTEVGELMSHLDHIETIPYGIYHFGSENNVSRYEITEYILRELNFDADNLLREKRAGIRDLRLSNEKIKGEGLSFRDSKTAISASIKAYQQQ